MTTDKRSKQLHFQTAGYLELCTWIDFDCVTQFRLGSVIPLFSMAIAIDRLRHSDVASKQG